MYSIINLYDHIGVPAMTSVSYLLSLGSDAAVLLGAALSSSLSASLAFKKKRNKKPSNSLSPNLNPPYPNQWSIRVYVLLNYVNNIKK